MGADIVRSRDARVIEITRHMHAMRARRVEQKKVDARWAALRAASPATRSADEPNRNFVEDDRAFSRIIADGAWAGHRCFIIGGGPSLRGFDFSRLRGELVIGVNRAFEFMDCTIAFSMDSRFYGWVRTGRLGEEAKRRFEDFKGYKVWLDTYGHKFDNVYLLRSLGRAGISKSLAEGLYNGNNSGYAALNMALCLGADPIYLLGFDMGYTPEATHFHDGYPIKTPEDKLIGFAKDFERVAEAAAGQGPRIVNLNRGSRLQCFEFGDMEGLAPISRPVICAYYTAGNGYDREAEFLRDSLRRWNLEHEILEVTDRGSWLANTSIKAQFIGERLEAHPGRDVVYVDVDAVFRNYPFEFEEFKADLGICVRDYALYPNVRRNSGDEVLTGTMYVKNNAASRELLRLWLAENEMNPGIWEQRNLQSVLERGAWLGDVKRFPISYCRIFDLQRCAEEPVIEHFQASRRLRERVTA